MISHTIISPGYRIMNGLLRIIRAVSSENVRIRLGFAELHVCMLPVYFSYLVPFAPRACGPEQTNLAHLQLNCLTQLTHNLFLRWLYYHFDNRRISQLILDNRTSIIDNLSISHFDNLSISKGFLLPLIIQTADVSDK